MSASKVRVLFKAFENLRLFAIRYVVLVAILVSAAAPSYGQNSSLIPPETIDRALNLARQIEKSNLTLKLPDTVSNLKLDQLSPERRLKILRQHSMNTAFLRSNLSPQQVLDLYSEEAENQNIERDIKIAKILQLQLLLQNADFAIEPGRSNLQELQAFRTDPDWFVAQRAALLESSLQVFGRSFDVGLKDAQAALDLIPNELNIDVLEAQFETYDFISYLQLVLKNVELGVVATEQVMKKGVAQDRAVDGISLINNMIYGFNAWREYETAEKLAEILFRISQKTDEKFNSFAYYRYGQAQNNAKHYDQALKTLDPALKNTEDSTLKWSIELARAISLAGLGRIEEAEQSLAKYDDYKATAEGTTAEHEEVKLQALALIAINNNDAETAANILDQKLKSVVQLQLSRQSKGIQSLQANLENDKERQAEREAAYIRERNLRQSELEAKQRSNMFLMALAGLMLFIAFCALGFAMWRQKISKILQIAAHEAEAGDRAKSQFLSVMSHELRTPLNGIIGIAGILSERGETEELRNYNKLILKSGQNLLELLSGILDMAQMESDKLRIVTAPASIRQIADGLYQTAKNDITSDNVEVTCFVAENIPDDLMLDSIRVKQALSNLISNAVRFTDQGRIHIHITMSEPTRRGIRDLTMIVADTGQGIAEDVQAKLFKPFAQADSSLTRDHDGAGIGLAVTRGLSRLMGGDVTMTSKAGRGSEFTMVIKTCVESDAKIDPETNRRVFIVEPSAEPKIDFAPAVSLEKLREDEAEKQRREFEQTKTVASAQPVEIEDTSDVEFETISADPNKPESTKTTGLEAVASSEPDNPRAGFTRRQARADDDDIAPDQLQGLNILIVEDVAANQEVLRSLLEPVGCKVSCAEHGQKALDMMGAQIFDAVIMDIRMPVLNGIETTKAIRKLSGPHQNVAIIALTADASAENNAECLAAGADVFLTKPVVVSELFSSIRFARRKQYRQKQQALSA